MGGEASRARSIRPQTVSAKLTPDPPRLVSLLFIALETPAGACGSLGMIPFPGAGRGDAVAFRPHLPGSARGGGESSRDWGCSEVLKCQHPGRAGDRIN